MDRPTIYDVAKLAAVSLATVSRVMNGADNVSPDTKKRVLDAIKELSYRPSSIAVELASKKNTHVAIIVPEINYTYVSHVVAGLMDKAKELGYECSIFTTKNQAKDITSTFAKVLSLGPKGIIVFNDELKASELESLVSSNIPLVTLGNEFENISSVTWHYKVQVRDIVDSALNRGKEVYFIKVAGAGKIEDRTIDGIRQVYEKKGRKFENFIHVDDSYEDAYEKVKSCLKDLKNPYIMAIRDSIALAGLNAALDLNYKVPEDVEFMATLGTKYSSLSRPKLSSMDINMRGFGKEGMEVLAEQIKNNNQVITKKLSFAFVKRGSSL